MPDAEVTVAAASEDLTSIAAGLFPELVVDDGPRQNTVANANSVESEGDGDPEVDEDDDSTTEEGDDSNEDDKTDADGDDQSEEDSDVLPPEHWPAEMKEDFAKLKDDEAKAILLEQSKQLERVYQKKFRAVAEERQRDAAGDGLWNAYRTNPEFQEYVNNFKKDAPVAKQEASPQGRTAEIAETYGLGERPGDDNPLGQLEYDAALKVAIRAEAVIANKLKPIEQRLGQSDLTSQIMQVRAHVESDPHFQDVQPAVLAFVESQPESLREEYKARFATDPRAYLELYNHLRPIAIQMAEKNKASQAVKPTKKLNPAKAPVLEATGASASNSSSGRKAKTKAKLEAARKGDDISSFLTGVVGRLQLGDI